VKSISVKNIIFSIILIAIIIGCFSLGIWQVDRYSQKKQLNNTPSDGVTVNITELISRQQSEDHIGKIVDVEGHFIADSVFKLDNKMSDSVYGVDVFSLFRELSTDRVYLVNMGWYEVGNNRDRLSNQFSFDGEHRLKAKVANFPSKPPFIDADHFRDDNIQDLWLFVNKEFLVQHYGVSVEELILVNQLPSNPLKYRETKKPDNAFMHILYAIQWFLFSFFALFGLIKIYK
jgi:cytochrome oxidase assembly protein ShyY1